MRFIINTSVNRFGGGLQVGLSLIEEFYKFGNHEFHVFLNDNLSAVLNRDKYPSNFYFYNIACLKFYEYNKYLSKLEKQINPDVVLSVFGPSYWRPKMRHIMGFAMGHYIYPDSPYWNIITWKDKIYWYLKKTIHLYFLKRDADEFIVETEDAANRLRKLLNKECHVVSNTYNHFFDDYIGNPILTLRFLPDKNENEFRLLSVCTPYLHKNLEIIPKVIEHLLHKTNFKIKFVLTISQDEYQSLIPIKYRDYVITVGKVTSDRLPQLYSECDFAFVPSLLECFTANFPEAMVMKKPILASDLGFAHSICKDAALYFNPLSPLDIAQKIVELIEKPKLQQALIARGLIQLKEFSTASQRAKSYIEILENNKR